MEKGHCLIRDHTRPAPIAGWDRGKPAAFDVTVTSPLCPAILNDYAKCLVQHLYGSRDPQATHQWFQMSEIRVDMRSFSCTKLSAFGVRRLASLSL